MNYLLDLTDEKKPYPEKPKKKVYVKEERVPQQSKLVVLFLCKAKNNPR